VTAAQAERAAARDGWFFWFGVWLHVFPWEIGFERPAYFDGSARDLCLAYGIETAGERV
jgi:hypothetical protein